MSENKLTLGQAIDRLIEALEPLDKPVRATALKAACAHLGIEIEGAELTRRTDPPAGVSPEAKHPPEAPLKARHPVTDIRSLREQKSPKSAKQMACLVAHYLHELAPEHDRKASISSDDIEKYFKQAGFALPKNIDQVLIDAKRSGYFDTAARGEYRLNAVGYNLAVHKLPGAAKS